MTEDNPKDIYKDLITRVKTEVKKKETVVFNPTTGIQQTFLDGKLLHTKQINQPRKPL